jgi:hypothetical protein
LVIIQSKQKMSDDTEDPRKKLEKFKPKKKKLSVPQEFLDNAKSYDDKLIVVKSITEREMRRMVLIMKKMLAEGIKNRDKK